MEGGGLDPRGLKSYEEVLGKEAPSGKPMTGVRELSINHLFADIWTRPHLSLRDRSLITIALLAAQGREDQLRAHIRGARRRGVSKDEILEVMVQVAHYAGWPAGMGGQLVAEGVFAQEG